MNEKIEKVLANLEKNNMQGIYVDKISDVVPKIKELISPGETVAVGGSMSLIDSGVLDLLRNGDYNFLDRYAAGLSTEDIRNLFIKSFSADTYFLSANAITENGELYNVDGNSNRVAALVFGPKSVIVVAGINKIVKDVDAAITRVKTITAPKNSARLNCDTYCSKTGKCIAADKADFSGCPSDSRICCNYVVSSHQRIKNRIKVILVGEELGY